MTVAHQQTDAQSLQGAALSHEITAILGMTREILQRVEQGEWQQAASLDGERQRQLQQLCARLEPRNTPREVLETLSQVLQLNDSLIGAVEQRRRGLLTEA